MLTYRALEVADATALASLALNPGLITWHPEVHATMDWQEILHEQDSGRALGAFQGQQLKGAAILRCCPHRRRSHCATFYLGVHPSAQHQGLGSRLLQEVLRMADWMQVGRLETAAYDHQPETVAFFAQHGFRTAVQQSGALRMDGQILHRVALEHLRPSFPWKPSRMARPSVAQSPQHAASIEVRRSTPQDFLAMPGLIGSESVLWGTLQMPWGSQGLWRGRLADPTAPTWIAATADGTAVACASLHGTSVPGHTHTWSLGMSVRDDYQGQGIGKRLLEQLLVFADTALGAHRVELEVYTDNPHAQALYTRAGFVQEGGRRAESWRYDGYADTFSMARLRD